MSRLPWNASGEGIEAGAHVEIVAGRIDEREIDGGTARMGRALARVGKEIRIGIMIPQGPGRFVGAETVEQPPTQVHLRGERNRARQQPGALRGQVTVGAALDRRAGQGVGGGVRTLERARNIRDRKTASAGKKVIVWVNPR